MSRATVIRPPETDIRRALDAAKEGDTASFQLLSSLSFHHRDIIKRTLPLVLAHLRNSPSRIPLRPFDKPRNEDVLASLALQTLRAGFEVWKMYGDVRRKLEPVFNAGWKSVLRWMNHLFENFGQADLTPPCKKNIPEDTPTIREKFLDYLVGCTPHLLMALPERSEILHSLEDDDQIGSLLARIMIYGGRNTNEDLLSSAMYVEAHLPPANGKRWKADFWRYVEQHPTAFAQCINSALGLYSKDPLQYSLKLKSLLSIVVTCLHGRVPIQDAFLEQKETIPTFTLALRKCTDVLELERQPAFRSSSRDVDFHRQLTNIVGLESFLVMSFRHGGPELVSTSLDQGLLYPYMQLHVAKDVHRGFGGNLNKGVDFEILDSGAYQVLETILAFSIFPCVFIRVRKFFSKADNADKILSAPPGKLLTRLTSSMVRLIDKVETEVTVLHNYGVQNNLPNYTSPFKFCDNAKCPSPGKAAILGRCSDCHSGLYCSRQCQAVVWKEGHRTECQKIVRTRGGFPMVLTIHDQEYFRRTLVSRLRQCKDSTDSVGVKARPIVTRDSVVTTDFTVFPTTLEVGEHEPGDELPAPSIRGKIPVCKSLCQDHTLNFPAIWVSKNLPLEFIDK